MTMGRMFGPGCHTKMKAGRGLDESIRTVISGPMLAPFGASGVSVKVSSSAGIRKLAAWISRGRVHQPRVSTVSTTAKMEAIRSPRNVAVSWSSVSA